MLNKAYYENDNLLIDTTISLNNNFYKQLNIDYVNSKYSVSYNSRYPSLLNADIYDTTNVNILSSSIEVIGDATAIISLPLHDEFINVYCNELCNDIYKYVLNDFSFKISGYVNFSQNDDAIFIYKYKNLVNNNQIYDYIKSQNGKFLYNNILQEVIEKEEITGYINVNLFPEYTIKCTDDTSIKYIKVELIDLNYLQGNVVSSTFYDLTSSIYDEYSLNVQNNSQKLPILLKSKVFRELLNNLRLQYQKIELLLNIKNQSNQNIVMNNSSVQFNWYMGFKFDLDLEFINIENLVDNKEYYLNRGLYLKYISKDLENVYSSERDRILFNINNIKLDYLDVAFDKSILISKNYISENNYYPLELYKDKSNILSIVVKDLVDDKIFVIDNDIKISLMRQITSSYSNYNYFNHESIHDIRLNEFGYLYASERTDFTNVITDTLYISSNIINNLYILTTALSVSDVTTLFNELDNSININLFQKRVNKYNSLIYIQYNLKDVYNYLYKFIQSDEMDIIIKNIYISITYYNYEKNGFEVTLFEPSNEFFINKYIDDMGKVTYLYSIPNMDIVSINSLYNKKEIDKYYYRENVQEYYKPKDVVYISNNKR